MTGRRSIYVSKLAAVVVLCVVVGLLAGHRQAAVQLPQKSNILLVITDDQDAPSASEMPSVQSRLAKKGTVFSRAFVTTSLCCPSRASIFRGQYAHNHGVWTNWHPDGGFKRFRKLGLENSTVATWLDAAGYDTAYMGKYMNQYGGYDEPNTYIPPGWDAWIGYEGSLDKETGPFKVNDGGTITRIEGEHDTDYLAREAEAYIRGRRAKVPWLLVVATNAPHEPARASQRNRGTYAGRKMPRTPAFNEADISDKASVWQDNPVLTDRCPPDYESRRRLQCVSEADQVWRKRMESLQDVDDMVDRLLTALAEGGLMDNTYVIFTSDNGFAMYGNRIFSKGAPYDPSHRVPFIVRGPGVPAGSVDDRLVANIDLAPTLAQWAGARTPPFVDGRSLAPILGNPDTPWRTRILFEHRLGNHAYQAVRTDSNRVYIEYPKTSEKEYYDLTDDPYQLDGQAVTPPTELDLQLQDLASCAGATCREADGPLLR